MNCSQQVSCIVHASRLGWDQPGYMLACVQIILLKVISFSTCMYVASFHVSVFLATETKP